MDGRIHAWANIAMHFPCMIYEYIKIAQPFSPVKLSTESKIEFRVQSVYLYVIHNVKKVEKKIWKGALVGTFSIDTS